jgi:hypothetical protein
MRALMIKDLSVTEPLDAKGMQAVRGGYGYGYVFPVFPSINVNNSKTVDAEQLVNNSVQVNNVSGNNDAFAGGMPAILNTNTFGQNNATVK